MSVPLTSCLTGLDQCVLQIKTKIVSCHTPDSKPVKQEVNGTVILPSLVFPAISFIKLTPSANNVQKYFACHRCSGSVGRKSVNNVLNIFSSSLMLHSNKLRYLTRSNGTVHNRPQCRKTTDLGCHRCLINIGVEKMNTFKYRLKLLPLDFSK